MTPPGDSAEPSTAALNRVEVGVEVIHSPAHSGPNQIFYVYFITITNRGGNRVQLMRRHWDIRSGDGSLRVVDDEGVIGQKPILEPGEEFSYHSGVPIARAPGLMGGYFTFRAIGTDGPGELFEVPIETFELYEPEGSLGRGRSSAGPRLLN
jgi:ApaG protein